MAIKQTIKYLPSLTALENNYTQKAQTSPHKSNLRTAVIFTNGKKDWDYKFHNILPLVKILFLCVSGHQHSCHQNVPKTIEKYISQKGNIEINAEFLKKQCLRV